jgi:hypothetical protein
MDNINLENSSSPNKLPPDMAIIPNIIKADKIAQKEEYFQVIKDGDERDANGNGHVAVLAESGGRQYKISYMVSDKEGGTPGKKWEKVPGSEEDLGPVPLTDTIQ